jgi:hypothetical protein
MQSSIVSQWRAKVMTSMLQWDDTESYEFGFRVGSQEANGEHMRGTDGWPYSVYREARQVGVSDIVICHGIQNRNDAEEIINRLQCLA